MAVIERAAARGPAALLEQIFQARGVLGGPDGRALYRYECQPADLSAMESLLAEASFPLEQRIRLVPLAAAERFRRSYREGPWSWEHCGPAVAELRRAAGLRFGPLLLDALVFWKLEVIRGDGMRRQYLETLVVNGGFPVAFVEGASVLRGLLKRLIAEHVRGGEAAAQHRAALEIPVSRLPRSYRQSIDFERLCVELAGEVAALARGYDSRSQSLSAYLAGIPGWEARLPLRLDSREAKQLLDELLLTAREAGGTGALDSAVCIRELRFEGGAWRALTELAPLPNTLDLAEDSNAPAVLKLGVTADGVAVRQLASLSRQPSGRHAVRPRPMASQLRIPAPFDTPGVSIGLVAIGAGRSITLPVRDGDALDAAVPWVFAQRDASSPGSSGEEWRLLAQGDARTRDEHVLLCVPEEAHVDGEIVERGCIEFATGRRRLIEAVGRVAVQCDDENFVIRTASASDAVTIELRGQQLSLRSPDASAVYAGAPAAELRDANSGTVLEWKASHGSQWSGKLRDAIGLVSYRARVGDEVVARRKALVLPAQFEARLRPGNEFHLSMAPGWFAAGTPCPRPIPDMPGQWCVPAKGDPGQPATAVVMVRPPATAPASVAWVELRSHARTSGFRELVTGSAAPPRASLDEVGRYEAFIPRHAGRLVHVSWGCNRTMPVACEVEHADGFSLPLSWIAEDLQDLASSREAVDESLRLELFDRGITSALEVAPVRLRREGDRVLAYGARAAVLDRLELVVRHFSMDASAILTPDPEQAGAWRLPEVFESGWALVTANLPSIRPQAVKFGEETSTADTGLLASILQVNLPAAERVRALGDRIVALAERPLEQTNDVDLAFLGDWLRRFQDVPGPYLDVVKALLDAPEPMLRLLAYSGARQSDALAERAAEAALWWHLMPVSAWQTLAAWWAEAIEGREGGHLVDPSVFNDVITSCADSLHVSDEDRYAFAIVLQFAVVSRRLKRANKDAFGAQAASRYAHDFAQWNQCLATAEAGGAQLPPLRLVTEQVDTVKASLPAALPKACDPDRLAYLIAPAACAIAAESGIAIAELRRELVLARRFDRSLFDSLFANTRIQLACV